MKPIYLDFQATTPVHASVVEKMTPFWSSEFGNPHSSEHIAGWTANATLNRCRDNVAALVGAFPEDVIFTSGATEANNLALLGHRASFPAREVFLSSTQQQSTNALLTRPKHSHVRLD